VLARAICAVADAAEEESAATFACVAAESNSEALRAATVRRFTARRRHKDADIALLALARRVGA